MCCLVVLFAFIQCSSFFTVMHAYKSNGEWELSANNVRVFIDKNQLAATLTASAFALIGPDVGYAVVHTWAEICVPKLCFRKMCSCV